MNYLQIERCSIENGLGVRVSLWVSGCSMNCPGCHNPETWAPDAGSVFDERAKSKLYECLGKPWVKGITLTGGHPLEPYNVNDVLDLLLEIKEKFCDKDVWLYTGLTIDIEDFNLDKDIRHIAPVLRLCDYIVDGPYIESMRDITLAFRGSTNQRIIDVKKTLAANEIVELQIE